MFVFAHWMSPQATALERGRPLLPCYVFDPRIFGVGTNEGDRERRCHLTLTSRPLAGSIIAFLGFRSRRVCLDVVVCDVVFLQTFAQSTLTTSCRRVPKLTLLR
jgi:hypothetical protein